jgi:UDP-GlcNAc:undecaprenyl-phosphate/decaprenyl-phosphate GlcNAc-1-phosphate transferase
VEVVSMSDIPYSFTLACLMALVISVLVIVICRPLAIKYSLVDEPNSRKQHQGAIPLIGGVAIFIGTIVPLVLLFDLSEKIFYLFATGSFILFMGLVDDHAGLGVRVRIFVQVMASILMIKSTGMYVENLGDLFGWGDIHLGQWGVVFTVVAILGLVNAYNMIDGIDGLLGSQVIIALIGAVLFQVNSGEILLVEYMAVLCAAILPYLSVNLGFFSKRKIFIGDAGSMFLGYILAWFFIYLSQSPVEAIKPVSVLWCLAVPVMDTVVVMGRRILKKKSIFSADREHLHHLFQLAKITDRESLLIIDALALSLMLLGFVVTSYSEQNSFVVFLICFCVYAYGILHPWRLHKLIQQLVGDRK